MSISAHSSDDSRGVWLIARLAVPSIVGGFSRAGAGLSTARRTAVMGH